MQTENPSMVSNEVFHEVCCGVCECPDYMVVVESRIAVNVTIAELQQLYSASSDHPLLDRLVRCKSCGFIYVSPRIDDSVLADSYAGAVDPTFVSQNPERILTFRHNLAWVCRTVNLVPSDKIRLLDVGCAGGAFLKAAKDMGFAVTGIEPSRWMANYARTEYGVDVVDGILTRGMFPPASFDVISLWDVIEHLPEPHDVLSAVHECLKPGGLLIINFPDVDSFLARLLGHRWPFYLSVHISYYTEATMRRQLERAAFQVLHTHAHWQKLKLGYVLSRLSKYTRFGRLLGWAARQCGISNMTFTYNMGQRLVVARRMQ